MNAFLLIFFAAGGDTLTSTALVPLCLFPGRRAAQNPSHTRPAMPRVDIWDVAKARGAPPIDAGFPRGFEER